MITVTVIQNEKVILSTIPIATPSKFYKPSLNFASLTKQPTEFLKNIVCNCAISSFIWDLDIFSLSETFDLRRTFMTPIFYGDFNESKDSKTSFSVNPATNYFIDYYKQNKPEFSLGDSPPFFDRVFI